MGSAWIVAYPDRTPFLPQCPDSRSDNQKGGRDPIVQRTISRIRRPPLDSAPTPPPQRLFDPLPQRWPKVRMGESQNPNRETRQPRPGRATLSAPQNKPPPNHPALRSPSAFGKSQPTRETENTCSSPWPGLSRVL